MKKILLICLSLLFVFSLCSCGTKEPVENVEPSDTITESPEPDDSTVNIEFKGDFLTEYSDPKYDGLDINKFLGTLIVKMRPEEYQIADIPVISPDSPNAEQIFTLLHLDPDYLKNYALSASSSSTRAYTLAIMESEPYYEEAIVAAIETRVADLYNQVQDYPDQVDLVKNTIVTQLGDFIVFIICDNQDLILEEIREVFTNLDLTTVDIIPFRTEEERKEIEDSAFEEENSDLFSDVGEVVVTPVEDEVVVPDENTETTDVSSSDSTNNS